jgi:HTH-type transcriptional regulator / antitoxin HipB
MAMRISSVTEVSSAVRSLRKERGWTQAELASRAQVSRDLVNRLERGSSRVELAKVLDVFSALGQLPLLEPRVSSVDLDAIVRAHGARE